MLNLHTVRSAGLIMGGIERTGSTATGPVARVAAVQSVLLLASSSDVASRLHIDDEGIAAEALRLWRAKFLDVVHEQQTSGDGAVSNYGLSSDSLSILLGRVSSASVPLIVAGYVIMVAFMLGAMTQWNSDESQAVFGLLSLLLVVCSTLAAFGFTSLLGVPFNAASTQVCQPCTRSRALVRHTCTHTLEVRRIRTHTPGAAVPRVGAGCRRPLRCCVCLP